MPNADYLFFTIIDHIFPIFSAFKKINHKYIFLPLFKKILRVFLNEAMCAVLLPSKSEYAVDTYPWTYTTFKFERAMESANVEIEYLLNQKRDDFYESKRPFKIRVLMGAVAEVPHSFRSNPEFINVCDLMTKLGLEVPPPVKHSITSRDCIIEAVPYFYFENSM
jgi:hypothetical protein